MQRNSNAFLFSLLFFIFLSLSIYPVNAQQDPDVNVLNIPQQLSQHLGISVFASQIILSAAVLLAIALPLGIAKVKGILNLVVLFVFMSVLVTIGWLPYWLMILVSLLVAVLYAKAFRGIM